MVFKMLYPKILNIEKGKIIKKMLLLISVIISILLVVINFCIDTTYKWSLLCIVGIIYAWLTTLYSLKRNVNIASHVMIQMICITALTVAIDYILGYEGWSITLAVPIIIMIGNVTLLILTIVSRKKYIKYAIYQLLIVIFSIMPVVFIHENLIHDKTLSIVAVAVSVMNLIVTLALCAKDVKEAVIRKFHL